MSVHQLTAARQQLLRRIARVRGRMDRRVSVVCERTRIAADVGRWALRHPLLATLASILFAGSAAGNRSESDSNQNPSWWDTLVHWIRSGTVSQSSDSSESAVETDTDTNAH